MPRLFVAIDLPTSIIAALAAIQPAMVPGLRLVAPSRMHLTLHFLGNVDIERMSTALRQVDAPAVPLWIQGVGRFPGRTTTLWAGVQQTAELAELHERLASALSRAGFRPEARPYHPHITLARGESHVPGSLMQQFLERHADLALPGFVAPSFHLYSSDLSGEAPLYRREASFELRV